MFIQKNGVLYKKDNTKVYLDINYYDCTYISVFLHGHEIAVINISDKILTLNDCGYKTTTTKSRLNAILSIYDLGKIYSKNYKWYLKTNDEEEEWTGSKTFKLKNND